MTYFSQFGEDQILLTIFGRGYAGQCAEVGANDGQYGSTTLALEKDGWDCLLVEPNPDLADHLRRTRSGTVAQCAAGAEDGTASLFVASGAPHADGVSAISSDEATARKRIEAYGFEARQVDVPVRMLDSIFRHAGVRPGIEFVSIDVEGYEHAALKGFDLAHWRPRILLIEDNSWFRDRTIADHLDKCGYVPFRRTGVNDWYAHHSDRQLATLANRRRYAFLRIVVPLRRLATKLARKSVHAAERRMPVLRRLRRRIAG